MDEVRGQDDGARMLGVVLEQAIVEDLPGNGIQAQVRLVEERERSTRSEAHDHAHGGELPAGELFDGAGDRQPKVLDQAGGEVRVPVGEEPRSAGEHMLAPKTVGVLLAFLDEADLLQHPGVLHRGLTEHLQGAAGGELLPGEQLHDRGLAGAVAAEQPVDLVRCHGEAHVVDGGDGAETFGESVDANDGGCGAGHERIANYQAGAMSSPHRRRYSRMSGWGSLDSWMAQDRPVRLSGSARQHTCG